MIPPSTTLLVSQQYNISIEKLIEDNLKVRTIDDDRRWVIRDVSKIIVSGKLLRFSEALLNGSLQS